MSTTTNVSIIVPCYKQAHYLDQSLQSVLDQSYENWECIIVNDGSPDDTEEVAKRWNEKDSRFKYLKKENGGLSSARNAGIAMANGIYILPLDADDVLHPQILKKLKPLLQDEAIKITSSYTDFFDKSISNKVGQLRPISGNVHDQLHVNQLIATSMYRKSSWEQVGGYDESMKKGFEDWEFWLRLLKDGSSFHIVPEVLFYYRKAKKSMLVNTLANHAIDIKKYIVHKHRDLYIEDFDNYVTVCAHDLKIATQKINRIEKSVAYKLGRVVMKPVDVLGKIFKKS